MSSTINVLGRVHLKDGFVLNQLLLTGWLTRFSFRRVAGFLHADWTISRGRISFAIDSDCSALWAPSCSGCYKCRETNCNQCLGLRCGILQKISILHFIRFIHLYHPLISVVSQRVLKWGMRLPQKNWRRKEKSKQRIESNYFLIIIIKCNLS